MFIKRLLMLASFISCLAYATEEKTATSKKELIKDTTKIIPEEFFGASQEYNFRISPDGKYLAFIQKGTKNYGIVITDLEKIEIIHRFAVSGSSPRSLTWLGNRRLIFGVEGAIQSVNIDGSDLHVLISQIYEPDKVKSFSALLKSYRYWSIFNSSSKNSEEVLVSSFDKDMYANIHRINVYTGEKEDLYDAKNLKANKLYADMDGNVRLVEKIKKSAHEFYKVDEGTATSKSPKLVSLDINSKTYNLNYDGHSYLDRRVIINAIDYENNVVYLSENVSNDRFQLVKYNYVTNQNDVIWSDDIYDVGTVDEPAEMKFSPITKKLIGFSYKAEKDKTVWLDEKFKKIQELVDARYPDRVNDIFDWSEKADKFLVFSWNAKSKGKVSIYLPEVKKFAVQSNYSEELDKYALPEKTGYKYVAQDGTTINSYLTLPQLDNEKLPLIVMPHGGPFARTEYSFDEFSAYFASRGYAVFEPNFRGSIGYGKNLLYNGKHEIADSMLSDMADGVKSLIAQGKVDPAQVYILGFSYGGYAAIMSSIKYPELYSAAVSCSAPLDLVKQLKSYKKDEAWFAYEFWQELIGLETKNKKYIESISPQFRADEIKIPLLVFHGENDEIVPKEQAEEFKKLVEKKNLNIPVRIMKSEGHGLGLVTSKVYFAEKSLELFRANKKQKTL